MTTKNRKIRVKANHSARTFTIRTYNGKELIAKYRTIKMSREEFESNLDNTEKDWEYFLRTSDYYKVN